MTAPDSYAARFDDLARLAYRVGYRVLGDREDAADVAQEAMARAYERWRKIEGYADAWVARVATNLALGVWRKQRPRADADEIAVDGDETRLLDRLDLVRRLQTLPRRQREVLALRYLADLTEQDVATALGCSVGAVKRHGHRGLTTLRLTEGVH